MSSTIPEHGGPAPGAVPAPQTQRPHAFTADAQAAYDGKLNELRANSDRWIGLGPAQRGALLAQVVTGLLRVGSQLVAASLAAKGLPPAGHAEGEEWLNVATSIRYARLLQRSLSEIDQYGHPHLPHPPHRDLGNRSVVKVYPDDIYEELSQPGTHAEVWMQPDVSLEATIASQAWAYHTAHPAQIVAVLGAGNSASLPPGDMLYQLFVAGHVVAFKFSPLNSYLEPLLAEALAPLINPGYLRLLSGGAAAGHYLAHHPLVDRVHLTGSRATYQQLVAGPPPLVKPLTAQLGNVTPAIIVPGPWRPADLEAQALAMATWASFNGGYACNTPQVIIQHRQWDLRDAFIERVAQILASTPARRAYYPGVTATHAALLARHPNAWRLGAPGPDDLPWMVVPRLDPTAHDEPLFTHEQFGPFFGETALDAPDPASFIEQAVAFANAHCWGQLAVMLVVHPDSLNDPRTRAAYEQGLADLRYGTVAVNVQPGESYHIGMTPWGAFPTGPGQDHSLGTGFVGNAAMLRSPEKSLLSGRFRPFAAPFMLGSSAMPLIAQRLAEAQAHPSPLNATRFTLTVLGG